MDTLLDKVRRAKRVYIIGNGGSYANAQHIANDLEMCGIRAYTINPATLTASANDHGYEHIYSRWIDLHGEHGDLLIAMSGSGKSPNILNAVATARRKDMDWYCLYGAEMGHDMQMAENYQIEVGHKLYKALRDSGPR